MGVLERTRHVIRADLNDLLRRASNPEAVLDGYLDDLEEVLAEATRLQSAEEAEREAHQAQLRDLQAAQKMWEQKARQCLAAGDEDLARSALEHKLDLQDEAAEVKGELARRDASLSALQESVELLQVRQAEVSRRRREVRSRRQLLQARSELQQAVHRLDRGEDQPALEAARDKLTEMEGALEASESDDAQTLDDRMLRLEAAEHRRQRQQLVEELLNQLRRPKTGKRKA